MGRQCFQSCLSVILFKGDPQMTTTCDAIGQSQVIWRPTPGQTCSIGIPQLQSIGIPSSYPHHMEITQTCSNLFTCSNLLTCSPYLLASRQLHCFFCFCTRVDPGFCQKRGPASWAKSCWSSNVYKASCLWLGSMVHLRTLEVFGILMRKYVCILHIPETLFSYLRHLVLHHKLIKIIHYIIL